MEEQSMQKSPIHSRNRRYVWFYVSIILFVVSFGMGFVFGKGWMIQKQVVSAQGKVVISKVVNFDRLFNKSDEVDFGQFWKVWDEIKAKYPKQPVKDTDMFYGAIQGLVYSLGDPYSVYFPPKAAEDFNKSLSGEFEGIGAELGIKFGQLVVISPLPGTPAERAGLRSADNIMKIGTTTTKEMDINDAVDLIRGPAGTDVVLTVYRNGEEKTREITITRAKIDVPSVTFSWKNNSVAYLRIMQFNEDTQGLFEKYIRQIKSRPAKGIILDLRSNPGGYLEGAVDVASEWIKTGPIVNERFSSTTINVHDTRGDHRLMGIKTAVLINGGSASASEIVAGALQDTKTATIIGEKSYGKGSVQDYESFPDGSALKLTVAEWLTPSGKNINESGIMPDILVKEEWEKEKVGEDIVIDKAMELLK
ncbi:MAG: hypothetical protein A2261_02830 [Candidatus Magasanikbacteria bacterium RIFOXYA2_FULL_44_8]|uniref:PDZ domain-containing protein n=1 Tax=Candidatus Magasanikbacteria bacterium RIFOXYA2_FULL_44_8 TaxID=1798696 RepID=A0A1F6NL12_9BACT|nr:MAG: hypothetical protein A2261_02830 [Candidatus Magasanikbacteria bacterium RIFOXYA2_FULL_44_8]